jgi:hypothetical protein
LSENAKLRQPRKAHAAINLPYDSITEIRSDGVECPLWVQTGKAQREQMSSGLPLRADIAQCSRHVSKVPKADSCARTRSLTEEMKS